MLCTKNVSEINTSQWTTGIVYSLKKYGFHIPATYFVRVTCFNPVFGKTRLPKFHINIVIANKRVRSYTYVEYKVFSDEI